MGNSVKVSIELRCAQCNRKLSTKGKTVSGRRHSWILMPDIWSTDYYPPDEQSSITITKGVQYSDGADDDMYCSEECVLKFVSSVLHKLKAEPQWGSHGAHKR